MGEERGNYIKQFKLVGRMPQPGSRTLTLKDETIEKIEELRAMMALRSWPLVVDALATKELRKRRRKK